MLCENARVVHVGEDGEFLPQSFQRGQDRGQFVAVAEGFWEKRLGIHSQGAADANHAHWRFGGEFLSERLKNGKGDGNACSPEEGTTGER